MKPTSLIKDGKADVGYYGDDFVQNRVTAIATFRTAQGEHKAWMRLPLQMVKEKSPEELNHFMIHRLNECIRTDIFCRAFNMVRRLKVKPRRSGYWEATLIHAGKRRVRTFEDFLNDFQ